MSKNSQYLVPYTENAKERVNQGLLPLSLGTFFSYKLKGATKSYSGNYKTALINSLKRINWVETKSQRGGVAYYEFNFEKLDDFRRSIMNAKIKEKIINK